MNRPLIVSIVLMIVVLFLFIAYSIPVQAQGPEVTNPTARTELERMRKQPAPAIPAGTAAATGAVGGVNIQGAAVNTSNAPTNAPAVGDAAPPPPRGLDMDSAAFAAAKIPPSRPNAPFKVPLGKDAPASADSRSAPVPLGISYQGPLFTGWIPPDPNVVPTMSDILVAYNEGFTIYDKATPGNQLYTSSFAAWYASAGYTFPSATSYFDPKVIYDYINNRVIMVTLALTRTGTFSESWLMVSVSNQNSASGSWWVHKLNLKYDGSTLTPWWADYPGVASDGTNLYVSVNMYDHVTGFFQYSKIRMLKLSELHAGSLASGWWDFWGFVGGDGVTPAFTAMPAHHYFSGPPTYFLARRHNLTVSSGNALSLFRLDLPASNNWPTSSPSLVLQSTITTGSTYTVPVDAAQPVTTTLIDTGDDRILSGRQFASDLWFTQNCLDDFVNTSALCLYGITTGGAKFHETHAFDDFYSGYYFPSLALDQNENIGIDFSRSSGSEYASIRRTGMKCCAFSALESSAQVKAGEDMYVLIYPGDARNRWGDFTGIERDPSVGFIFWLFNEYAKPKVSSSKLGGRWGTWVSTAGYPTSQHFLPLIER